jgi:hypothetical protein
MLDNDNQGVTDAGDDTVVSDADVSAQDKTPVADAKPADKGTAFDVDDTDDAAADKAGKWPEDWRDKFANGDDKVMARLKRFASPDNVLKAWLESDKRIRSGQFKKALADDATPEEVAAWKKENGLPEKAEDYAFDDLGDGYVLSEDDKPMLDGFKEVAFAKNISPADAKDLVKWFKQQEDAAVIQRAEADNAAKIEAIEDLRAEYGSEFRANMSAGKNLLVTMFGGEEPVAEFLSARLPDGSVLGNNPGLMKPLIAYAKEHFDAGLMPGGGAAKAEEDEFATIERKMKEDFDAYQRDLEMQARYLELLERRQRRGSK